MSIRRHSPELAILLLSLNTCIAQEVSYTDTGPITVGSTLTIQSKILEEDRKILVSLPDDYLASTSSYPVIYLLDAHYYFQFQYAYGLLNALAFVQKVPQVILVGIHTEDRTSDLTPLTSSNPGNADNFRKFLKDELQVFINQRYRTEPYSILIGHSAGGLFAMHALVNEPDTFNGYIAISPAVWSDNASFMSGLEARLKEHREFDNSLFTSLSTEGEPEETIYENLVAMLTEASPPGLEFRHRHFPEEDHTSSIMPGMHYGLLAMYENWVLPASANSLDALVSHYQSLSERYGYTVDIPTIHASRLGFRLVDSGDPRAGLELFEYYLANISQDAIAHYQLGYALRSLGRLPEALEEFEEAIELGEGTDMFTVYVRSRDEVAQELREQDAPSG